MTLTNVPIGIFDSGIGGISILQEIQRTLPQEDLIYVADSAYTPYGDRSKTEIVNRCRQIIAFLCQQKVKIVVVACNTATAAAIEILRQENNIPIIGVEPAIKPAAKITKTKAIAVLATEYTLHSDKFKQAIQRHANHLAVSLCVGEGLVELIELGKTNSPQVYKKLRQYTDKMLKNNADVIVLGCTHYPFLRATLRKIVGENIAILETSKPVTRHLMAILKRKKCLQTKSHQGKLSFFSSDCNHKNKQNIYNLWQKTVNIAQLPRKYC